MPVQNYSVRCVLFAFPRDTDTRQYITLNIRQDEGLCRGLVRWVYEQGRIHGPRMCLAFEFAVGLDLGKWRVVVRLDPPPVASQGIEHDLCIRGMREIGRASCRER